MHRKWALKAFVLFYIRTSRVVHISQPVARLSECPLSRQADELTERTSPDQARRIKEPLAEVNRRWGDLNKSIVVRQKELEHALLRLGQFQHALSELLVWIERTDKTLDTLKPVYGDPQVIEVELAAGRLSVGL